MDMNLDPINYPSPDRGDVIDPLTRTSIDPAAVANPPGPQELYSPEWWRDRLIKRLNARAASGQALWDFYEGDQPLLFASKEFLDAYQTRFRAHSGNFMPLVVDAEKNRLAVQGFRFGTSESADKGVWRIWQRNQLDAESAIAHEIALVKGESYTLTAPGPNGPVITVEDPAEVIVESAPGSRRIRLAALKQFRDDDGYVRVYLYLPDEIYKWRSERPRTTEGSSPRWVPDPAEDEDWPMVNALGVVPIVPLVNRPTRAGYGRSEVTYGAPFQSKINFLSYSALVGSDVAALPQRWAKNIDIPIDPNTGKPTAPFKTGKHNLWTTAKPAPDEVAEYGDNFPDPEFGQFPAADLNPFVALTRQCLSEMAAATATPFYYLFGDPGSIPPSGESRKASEAPLITKVKWQSIHFGEGWEETMRLALVASGQRSKARTDAETIWVDPETRNEAANTDSVLKQYQAGLLPDEVALEELGYSQQQITRIKAMKSGQPASTEPPAPAGPGV